MRKSMINTQFGFRNNGVWQQTEFWMKDYNLEHPRFQSLINYGMK